MPQPLLSSEVPRKKKKKKMHIWTITHGQYMHPQPGHKFLVSQGQRSRSQRSNFSDLGKIAITSLTVVVETQTKRQNVKEGEFYHLTL